MPFIAYDQTILGTQSTVNGSPHDYNFAPPAGGTWSYSGDLITHVVYEEGAGTFYNGDNDPNVPGDNVNNERIRSQERIGEESEQSTEIDGTAHPIIYELSFTVTDGTNTYEIAVLDVDLNNDNDVEDTVGGVSEDGYYLVFIGDVPPPNTDLTVQSSISDNSLGRSHEELGGEIVCFAAGTLITTRRGDVAVEALRIGDEVLTLDDGYQPVRWHRARRLAREVLHRAPHLHPIRIRAGALGVDRPTRDLLVSPQHRMLMRSVVAKRMFDTPEILVAAKHLLGLEGVEVAEDCATVTYCHFMFDRHQVVFANGAPSESFYPGPMALQTVGDAAREEIMSIFGKVDCRACPPASARALTSGPRARRFAWRLSKNNKPALEVEMC